MIQTAQEQDSRSYSVNKWRTRNRTQGLSRSVNKLAIMTTDESGSCTALREIQLALNKDFSLNWSVGILFWPREIRLLYYKHTTISSQHTIWSVNIYIGTYLQILRFTRRSTRKEHGLWAPPQGDWNVELEQQQLEHHAYAWWLACDHQLSMYVHFPICIKLAARMSKTNIGGTIRYHRTLSLRSGWPALLLYLSKSSWSATTNSACTSLI